MSQTLNVNDTIKYINNVMSTNSDITKKVYINLDLMVKIIRIGNELYKNVPSIRSKIIETKKSYKINKTVYDILDLLNEKCKLSKNICVISDDSGIKEYIELKNIDVETITNDQFNGFDQIEKKLQYKYFKF
jgi:hypothetical protein